jgi:hypothetical protein
VEEPKIILKSSHIYLNVNLVEKIFKSVHYAYIAYLPKQKKMLITPVSSLWFVKIHKPTQFLLKSRNLQGDKTLAIREILIDHNLDTTDRIMQYETIEKTNLIVIAI